MTRVYYKDAHGCVIMFDLSNKNSFLNTLKWKKDVDAKCTQSDGSPIPCMLLGNKVRHNILIKKKLFLYNIDLLLINFKSNTIIMKWIKEFYIYNYQKTENYYKF